MLFYKPTHNAERQKRDYMRQRDMIEALKQTRENILIYESSLRNYRRYYKELTAQLLGTQKKGKK
jgi:hypothetical protein